MFANVDVSSGNERTVPYRKITELNRNKHYPKFTNVKIQTIHKKFLQRQTLINANWYSTPAILLALIFPPVNL